MIPAGVITNMVFVSALFSIPVIGGELMTNGSIFKRSKRRSRAIPALLLLGAAFAVLFAFSETAASVVGGEVLSFKRFLLAMIPAIVSLVAFEIYKFTQRKKNFEKENEFK